MIRNIIFDWSGTLVDDLPPVLEAMNRIFVEHGYTAMSREEFGRSFSLPFDRWYAEKFPDLPLDLIEKKYHAYFDPIQDRVEPLPHAGAFLEFARQSGRRLFLLSSIHAKHWEQQSARLGFAHYFEKPYVQVLDKRAKIHEILADHQLVPEETMFVGDMTHDIETGHHGGVTTVAVATGFEPPDRLLTAHPHLLVEHLGHLQRLLTQLSPIDTMPLATVGALIFDPEDRVLMIRTHKWSDLWGIPGGKIKRGETSEEALRREIREETGLPIDQIRFVMAQDCIDSDEFMRPAHFVLLNYTARTGFHEVRLNEEAEHFEWLPMADALKLPLNRPTRILLEAVKPAESLHA